MIPTAFYHNNRRYDIEYSFVDYGAKMYVVRYTDGNGNVRREVWSESVVKRHVGKQD